MRCIDDKEIRNGQFGEGAVTICQYFIPANDTVTMDTSNHLFMRMTYYIKGNKILRRDKETETFFADANDTSSSKKGNAISDFKALLVHPSYLIDWDKKTAFTFFRQKGKTVASEDSLKNLTTESFFRRMLPSIQVETFVLDTVEERNITIAGNRCKTGFAIIANQKATFNFIEKKLPFISPLNSFLPSFQGDLLSIRVRMVSDDGNTFYGYALFIIESFEDSIFDDKLFTIPKGVQVRQKVPWQEMYDQRLQ